MCLSFLLNKNYNLIARIGFYYYLKKKYVIIVKLIVVAFLYLFCTRLNAFSADVVENQTFLEADYLKKSDDNFFASGHVILKRISMLINTDELKGIKNVKVAQKEMELQHKLNEIDKASREDKNHNDDKYKFYAKNWVKMRTDDDNIIFAKSMFYDENSKNGLMHNVQIYPGQKHNHTEIYTTRLDKNDCIFNMNNVSICPCRLFLDSNIENNRKRIFSNMEEEDELLEKPMEKNAIDNNDREMHDKIRKTIISLNADRIIYDSIENLMTFKRLKLRVLGVPVMYIPTYSMHVDDSGDSGVLMPQLIIIGKKQLGVELPLYLKILPNMDILFSRTQFFETGLGTLQYANIENNAYRLKDLSKLREGSSQLRFRHLISTKYNYENFYRIEAMITDKTQLVNNSTGLGKTHDNGDKVMGYRWMLDFRTRMKFSNTTFLKADINWASDKNLLYYYKFDPRQIQENKIHLYDVSENRYVSVELFNYQSRMLQLEETTTPIIFPVIRAEYDFKKDRIGGNIYFRSKAFYINREEGFNVGNVGIDFGYHLPFVSKFGTKLTFDAILRNVYNNTTFNEYSQIGFSPFQYYIGAASVLNANLTYYFGNYGGLLQNIGYIGNDYRHNYFQALGVIKTQAEHPIVVWSFFGKTIITPKIALKYAPNLNSKHLSPVEDNLFTRVSYLNLFELTQSNGYGLYDSGGSFVYGLDFRHRFQRKIELFGSVAQNMRLGHSLDQDFLMYTTGYRKVMSDIVGNFGISIRSISIGGYMNYDNHEHCARMLAFYTQYNNPFVMLNVSYNLYNKNATIIGAAFDVLSSSIVLLPTQNLRIIANMNYNFKGFNTLYGWKNGGLTYIGGGVYYRISCISLGFVISKSFFSLTGIPNDVVYRFKFTFSGFG